MAIVLVLDSNGLRFSATFTSWRFACSEKVLYFMDMANKNMQLRASNGSILANIPAPMQRQSMEHLLPYLAMFAALEMPL